MSPTPRSTPTPEELTQLIRSDDAVYRAIIADIHAQSVYLIRAKYRWLRISYVLLLGGFLGARWCRFRRDSDPHGDGATCAVLDPVGAGDQGG